MVKKLAASRKAAPKAPARKATKAKVVTAPKVYKPKGSKKERLAYLNKGEMKTLEARKGSPARRGPKGLPSFADDSASSKGVSRGDSYGTKGSGSTKTSTGSVSNASTGARGTGSNYGAGSGRPGTSSSPSPTGGGNSGYNSGTSGSRYGGASTQRPGMGRNEGQVGPRSPMGSQGTSFSSPKAAKDYNRTTGMGIEDRSRMTRPFSREMEEDDYYNRQLDDLRKDTLRVDRTIAGVFAEPTRNAGEYAAKMANAARRTAERRAAANELAERNYNIRNANADRSQMPMRDTRAIGRDLMENVGNQRLPSRGGGVTSVSSVAGGKESRGGRGMKAGGQAKRTFKDK